MAKKTAPPKLKKPQIDPFDLAIITGAPLPAKFNTLRAHYSRLEDTTLPGLIPSMVPPLADVWRDYHGKTMTEADAAAIAARVPEVEAARAKMRAARKAAPAPAASNWPASETENFQPIARIEDNDE